MQQRFLLLLFILTLCWPFVADANTVTMNMRNADVRAVIQWLADLGNKQVIIAPDVNGKISINAQQNLSPEQAYRVIITALNVNGFATTESQGILRVTRSNQAKSSPAAIIDSFKHQNNGEQAVLVTATRNVKAKDIIPIIQPLLSNSGVIEAAANNQLIVADSNDNLKRLDQLIKQIDHSGKVAMAVIKLQHASADKLLPVLESLLPDKKRSHFNIARDEYSNSILMAGDYETRQQIKQLVRELDRPLARQGDTQVFFLHYIDSKEALQVLKGMAKTMDKQRENAKIGIEASDSANAIVVTAPVTEMDAIAKIIRNIDKRRSQVLVEAVIVEVSENFYQQLGVEWNTSSNSNFRANTQFGLSSPAENIGNLLTLGLSMGWYKNGSLHALLQAIRQDTDSDIVSTPSIVTLDNEPAEILVGSNVPFITGRSSGDASSTENPFTVIQRQDIGLSLKITPTINQQNAVTLAIEQTLETIDPSTTVASDITTSKRQIKTKVIVNDNNLIVLGGLISDEAKQTEKKVPVLGDIPLLGRAFKSTEETIEKRNLMVFIRPTIIDKENKAEEATLQQYEKMQEQRESFIYKDLIESP